jgi:hypothetical protein
MPEWLLIPLVMAAYIVVMKWLMPRFGMPT